ncbi:hypothetical protein BH10ACT5_BH10ACT5_08850 [soil metagenome]
MIVVCNYWTHPAPRWAADYLASASAAVYFTGLGFPRDGGLVRIPLPGIIRREVERRLLPPALTRTRVRSLAVTLTVASVLAQRLGKERLHVRLVRQVNLQAQRRTIRYLRRNRKHITGVLATASMSDRVVAYCAQNEIPTMLYLPLPHYDYAQSQLASLGTQRAGVPAYTNEHELNREMDLANGFLGGSSMVRESTIPWSPKPTIIHPPGIDGIEGIAPRLETVQIDAAARAVRPLRIVYVGRAAPQKGLRYLFEAISSLESERPVHLTIYSADAKLIRAEVARRSLQDRIWVKEALPRPLLLEALGSFDLFVLPSLYEGFALVLAEALACGLPIVATSMTGASDIDLDQRAGIVVPPGDRYALAAAITTLVEDDDLRAAYAAQARLVAATLTWKQYAHDVGPELVAFFDANDAKHSKNGAAVTA